MKKPGKMPGEGKRWKWKALNVTGWKGAPAKRMPGFHLRKKNKGKGKGRKSQKIAGAAATIVPQPPTVPMGQQVAPATLSQPQIAPTAYAAPVPPAPHVPVAPG